MSGWAYSHGIALRLDQSLVGHVHKFCSTFTSMQCKDRTNCTSKILWLHRCPSPTIGSLACLQKMASSGPVSPVTGSPHWNHPHRYQGVSIAQDFHIAPQSSPILVISPSILSLHPFSHQISVVPSLISF